VEGEGDSEAVEGEDSVGGGNQGGLAFIGVNGVDDGHRIICCIIS